MSSYSIPQALDKIVKALDGIHTEMCLAREDRKDVWIKQEMKEADARALEHAEKMDREVHSNMHLAKICHCKDRTVTKNDSAPAGWTS